MVKLARTPEPQAPSHRAQDICGLVLFFLGAAALLCLTWRQEGLLPGPVADLLRSIAGIGAFVIPLLLMFTGAMFLLGYQRFSFSSSSLGTVLLFLVFVTWRHLVGVPDPSHWTTEQVRRAGGWIGGLFGASSHALLGTQISYLLLVLLSAVGVVLIADQPFVMLMRRFRERSLGGVAVVGQAAGTARRAVARPADVPALVGAGSRRATKTLPPILQRLPS